MYILLTHKVSLYTRSGKTYGQLKCTKALKPAFLNDFKVIISSYSFDSGLLLIVVLYFAAVSHFIAASCLSFPDNLVLLALFRHGWRFPWQRVGRRLWLNGELVDRSGLAGWSGILAKGRRVGGGQVWCQSCGGQWGGNGEEIEEWPPRGHVSPIL